MGVQEHTVMKSSGQASVLRAAHYSLIAYQRRLPNPRSLLSQSRKGHRLKFSFPLQSIAIASPNPLK